MFILTVVFLAMLSAAQIVQCQTVGQPTNNKRKHVEGIKCWLK